MARYKTFSYGEKKYGEESGLADLLWALEIDWDRDQVFDGSNIAYRMVDLDIVRGKEKIVNIDGKGFEPAEVGEANIKLDNYDDLFNPWNTGSDLYGYLGTGMLAKIWVRYSGVDYPLMAGRVTDLRPVPGKGDFYSLKINDGWEFCQNAPPNVPLLAGYRHDQILDSILTAINYPSIFGSSLAISPDTIPYWWAMGENSKDSIENIVNSGLGFGFFDGSGQFVYYSRHLSDSSVLTISDEEILKYPSNSLPWESVRNLIRIFYYPIVVQSSADLWELNDTPYIGSGESISFYGEYSYDGDKCPATNIINPVQTTDYTMNENEGGGGADLTANFSVVVVPYSKDFQITITNNGGTGGYVTWARLRGDAITRPDSSFVEAFGDNYDVDPKLLELDLPFQQDRNVAQDFATFIAGWLDEDLPFPVISYQDRFSNQLPRDLYQRVTWNSSKLGINQDFRIGKIHHKWNDPTGQSMTSEFSLLPSFDTGSGAFWIVGLSGLNVGTIMGW